MQRLSDPIDRKAELEKKLKCFLAVQNELSRRESGILLPQFLLNRNGEAVSGLKDGLYTVQTYLQNDQVTVLNTDTARSAGRLLARLRTDLDGWMPQEKE